VFDSEFSGEVAVEAGSVFLVFPKVWHRYRPDRETGWSEYWVEAGGPMLESAVRRAGMNAASPVMRVGHDDALLRCFLNIADTIQREDPGFEAIIGIRSLEIVARIRSLMMIARSTGVTTPEQIVRQAQLSMRENLGGAVDLQNLARQLGVSYSSFRRVFKDETGRAPGEYFIEMKINRARQLLMADMGIQEVADLLGFDSPHYFSRLFKARAGVTPGSLRPSRSGNRQAP
jgi:AraC-like DNA-binding protein